MQSSFLFSLIASMAILYGLYLLWASYALAARREASPISDEVNDQASSLTNGVDEVVMLPHDTLGKLTSEKWLSFKEYKGLDEPMHLKVLVLNKTGVKQLPLEGINVEELLIDEDHLTEVKGEVPRLRMLKLKTPALKTLWLFQFKLDLLPPGFSEKKPDLRNIKLVRVTGQLPEEFLRGASRLVKYATEDSDLTSLPSDLFSYSPELEFINLANNRISSLPRGIFSGLPKLKTLWLVNNQLTQAALSEIEYLSGLINLGFSGPIGDLCETGRKSKIWRLSKLERLDLSNTGGTRLCRDWISDMLSLSNLNFKNNRMQEIDCADLHFVRDQTIDSPIIDLSGNPINSTICEMSEFNYVQTLGNAPKKELKIILNWTIKCSCGWRMMSRVLPLLHVSLQHGSEGGEQICGWQKAVQENC